MKCELCNADPMTANCNGANCMTKHTDTPQHTHLWELTVCDCGEWRGDRNIMSKCTNCKELVAEEWSANNGLCDPCEMDRAVMTNHTDTPDPLTDMFEDMGIKVVDVTPNKHTDTDIECHIVDGVCISNQYPKHQCIEHTDTDVSQNAHSDTPDQSSIVADTRTDTDELRWACLNEDCMVDNKEDDDVCTACGCTKDFISPRIEARFTAYTTNRERALLDELEKIVNRRWGEITTDTGDKAVLRDHLNHFIKSKRGLQNQTSKEQTNDQL